MLSTTAVRAPRRRIAMWAVMSAVIVVAASCGSSESGSSSTSSSTVPAVTTTLPPTTITTIGATTTTLPSITVPSVAPYQPMWPFRTVQEVQAWQAAYAASGEQPWHLDAKATAQAFTMGFLGFNEVNLVIGVTVDDKGAHVAVGYHTEGTLTGTSAVLHLFRWGSGSTAPWEVVGSDDPPTLSLSIPGYGSTITSPVTMGGTLDGIDENIRVEVRQPSSIAPLGEWCCLNIGGFGTQWRATTTFSGATDPVLTLVAHTGGHLQRVERFAIQAAVPAAS